MVFSKIKVQYSLPYLNTGIDTTNRLIEKSTILKSNQKSILWDVLVTVLLQFYVTRYKYWWHRGFTVYLLKTVSTQEINVYDWLRYNLQWNNFEYLIND